MNPDPSKLRQQQDLSEESAANLPLQTQGLEFSSVEEIMRFDSDHTPVPEELTQRLKESVACEPAPRRPWWRRLFSST